MTQIIRTNVIEGSTNDPFHVDEAFHATDPVVANVVVSAADILDLDSNAVALLPDPPEGRAYEVLGVRGDKPAGAFSAGAAVTINYTNAAGTLVATIAAGHFRSASADTRWGSLPARTGNPTSQNPPAHGLELPTIGTAFTGTGADVTFEILYLEVPV